MQELWARGMQSTPFVTMLTNMIVDCGTRLKKQGQDFSLRTHNKPSAEKLVIHMYDKAWNAHTTEFDIVKEMYLY